LKKKIDYRLFFISTALFFITCSADKNTAPRRAYHNLTAHYNIYFNGNESFKSGILKIKAVPENYNSILPIFPEETDAAAVAAQSDMDDAVKKAVKLIKMHSITAKPARKKSKSGKKGEKLSKEQDEFYKKTEYCNWVDDSYLLIGKAHYYKHDFETGMKSLQLILNKFKTEKIRFDAMYWIARSYDGLGEFPDAVNYLNMIRAEENYPKKYDREIELVNADIFVKQKDYEKAAVSLSKVIALTKKRKEKVRLEFILAQIYQKLDKSTDAINLYTTVVKSNPPYEMAFNAKINMAKSFNADAGNSNDLKKILDKMLKDDKNIDYLDQIYYVLGDIARKEKDEKTAVVDFKLSLRKSTTNTNQKALSYLALADIYFARPDYMNAGAYYDSTMTVLDKKYPDYDAVALKAGNLSGLIKNLKTIQEQDSLQRIARMSESERKKYIESLIAQVKQKEAEAKMSGQNSNYDPYSINGNGSDNPQNKGNWYFYNPTAIGIGMSEFKKVWGNRKLEDHWRRKNKAAIVENNDNTAKADSAGKVTDNKNPKYYLQNLPLTDSLVRLSNLKIIAAMFDVGDIYEKKMNDYPEAVKSYEELLQRFPKNDLELESYFNLYLIHLKYTKNAGQCEKYRQKILNEYPKSKYAKILSDPDYLKKLEETKDVVDKFYEEAYAAYRNNDLATVLSKTDAAFAISPDNDLKAKFLFLKANALGQSGDRTQMKEILKKIVSDFPKDEITPRAKDEIAVLESGKFEPDLYKFDENAPMYCEIVIADKPEILNQLKFAFSNFNVEKFPDKDLKIETMPIADKRIQIVIKSLRGKSEAENYLNQINSNSVFGELKPTDYDCFLISVENFDKLQKLPDTDKYLEFYHKNY
jgi:tetratricopeptide (TPR) repeat protein